LPTSGFTLGFATRLLVSLMTLTFLLTATSSVLAVSASPELVEELRATGQVQKFVDRLNVARSNGVWQPQPSITASREIEGKALNFDPANPDTFRVLVILVDFDDNPAPSGQVYGQPADFEELLFSDDPNDDVWSMAEFYRENSYGNFVMQGQVVGWYRAPQTYAYYVDANNGFGSYPQNAQKMAEDAILAADSDVDYSQFDADGNGWMDGVFIVHAGPGAEQTGSDYMIWSHKWNLASSLYLDGVNISAYTTEPEENTSVGLTTMGVYAHEYGHFIGLPDLYDTDYSSSGIGDWSLMAGGSWNYGGRYPAFFDAWCKKQVGFLNLTNVSTNMVDVPIETSYYTGTAYRLWANGGVGPEYFLIENRQKGEFDKGVPGTGLVVYHIDESVGGNSNESHPLVAVEQADGEFELEAGTSSGDGGDVWSTATKIEFDDLSMPNTRNYAGEKTKTAVWGISASDSIMSAGFDIAYSRPRFEILSGSFSDAEYGNDNGHAEAGETLTFNFNVKNLWLTATNVTGTLTADNNDIIFDTPSSNIGTVVGEGGTGTNTLAPIIFTVPSDFVPCIDSFFLEIDSDVTGGARIFGFELHIGDPTVLIVDDDNGGDYNEVLEGLLFNLRTPFAIYSTLDSGAPSGAILNSYSTVHWLTGDERADILSTGDIAAIESFLDNGGNLFLSGQTIVKELDTDDQSFLNNYLRAGYDGDAFYPLMYGVSGGEIGDGLQFRFGTPTNQTDPQKMTPINGANAEFTIPIGGTTVLSYAGDYKLVLMSFGFETVSDAYAAQGWANRDTIFGRIVRFFEPDTASLNPMVLTTAVPAAPSVMNLTDHTPTFSWSVNDTTGASVLEYEIQVGSGSLCYNWDDMWSPGVFTGSETSIVYDGLPLIDGESYVFRVRVFNGTDWSAWKELPFHMNAVGSPALLVEPIDDFVVSIDTPLLKVTFTVDPDDDIQTYDFEVYSDAGLSTLVASATGVAVASPHTSWTAAPALAEDGHFWWRARAFDGFEYTGYTATGSFYVNAANAAPSAFSLVDPPDGSNVLDLYPKLTWQTAVDYDAADSVRYTVWSATNASFAGAVKIEDLTDTSRTLNYAVLPNETYYWKIEARDRADALTWSSETFTFLTSPPTCCVLRGNVDGFGEVNVSDLTYLVTFLFQGGSLPPCEEESDIDYSGEVNVSDLTYLVAYLFQGGPIAPACPS